MNIGIEGEDMQTKGLGDIFNQVVAENFPNLEKEMVIQIQEAFRILNEQEDYLKQALEHEILLVKP
jgi:hypothetical protein